ILEEGVHLLHVEAAEHPDGELLLANVHGRDPHGDLLLLSTASGAASAGPPAPRTGWRSARSAGTGQARRSSMAATGVGREPARARSPGEGRRRSDCAGPGSPM